MLIIMSEKHSYQLDDIVQVTCLDEIMTIQIAFPGIDYNRFHLFQLSILFNWTQFSYGFSSFLTIIRAIIEASETSQYSARSSSHPRITHPGMQYSSAELIMHQYSVGSFVEEAMLIWPFSVSLGIHSKQW